MLSIPEELFLLTLHEKKGVITVTAQQSLPYGLAGAILTELTLAERLIAQPDRKKLAIQNTTPLGDELLDAALAQIVTSRGPWTAKYWIYSLGQHPKKLARTLATRLVNKGILQQEEKKLLWVIPYTVYPERDATAKYWLKERLRAVVLAGQQPDERTLALLSLVKACRLMNLIFTKDERKAARKQIEALTTGDWISDAVARTLEEIDAAVTAAIVASSYS